MTGAVVSGIATTTALFKVRTTLGSVVHVSFVNPWKFALYVPTEAGAVIVKLTVEEVLLMSVVFAHVLTEAEDEIPHFTDLHFAPELESCATPVTAAEIEALGATVTDDKVLSVAELKVGAPAANVLCAGKRNPRTIARLNPADMYLFI
jgi:hypothetical protein